MKVAILECDYVPERFQRQFGHYSGMIRHMLDATDHKFEFDIYDCRRGDYPPNLDAYDFFITTGSKAGAYDDSPWIKQLIKFIRRLDEERKKLIGICFGHQIIAITRHGKVEKSDKGWGVGIAGNRIINSPDWMQEKRPQFRLLVSHQDQVTELPDDALVIAESDFCPYFVVQWSDHFLSVQGHPEWKNGYSRALINNRREIIPRERVEAGLNSLTEQPENALFTQWILDFILYYR